MDKIDMSQFDVSNFDPNAILRGAQLTLVGVNRALQNPGLFTSDHYRQAAIAVAAGVAIRIIVAIPIVGVRVLLWILSLFVNMDHTSMDESVVNGLHFLEHTVLQVPFFLMTMMRYVTPTLDRMFMDSLRWVDETYVQKHKTEDPHNLRAMYYPNLEKYPDHAPKPEKEKKPIKQAIMLYATKQGRKAAISLAVLALSYVPYVGRFVLPAASFYTFKKSVGTQPAAAIFAGSLLFPPQIPGQLPASLLLVADSYARAARALLHTRSLQQRAKEALVQRPSWCALWFRPRLLHLCQDTPRRRPHLRSRRSVHGISHHEDHRAATPAHRSRQVQGRVTALEEQTRVPESAMAAHGRIQSRNAQAQGPIRSTPNTTKDLQLVCDDVNPPGDKLYVSGKLPLNMTNTRLRTLENEPQLGHAPSAIRYI